MASARERTARKPGQDRRREIAEAALRVIATEGLGRFTSLAIARQVGLTDGALFRHFPTKQAIVDAAIDRVEELLFEALPPPGGDPVDRLGAFFRRRVATIRAQPGISSLVTSDELAKAGSPEAVRRVAGLRRRSTGFVRSCLVEAEQLGLLAPGLGADEAAVVVLGAILALAHSTFVAGDREPTAIAPRVWSALERFLRGPPDRPPPASPRCRPRRHPPKGEEP